MQQKRGYGGKEGVERIWIGGAKIIKRQGHHRRSDQTN